MEEGETMNRNMNNFTPLPGLWRTGSRSYDAPQTSNNTEFNEVPVFYRSHSTRATVSICILHILDLIPRFLGHDTGYNKTN